MKLNNLYFLLFSGMLLNISMVEAGLFSNLFRKQSVEQQEENSNEEAIIRKFDSIRDCQLNIYNIASDYCHKQPINTLSFFALLSSMFTSIKPLDSMDRAILPTACSNAFQNFILYQVENPNAKDLFSFLKENKSLIAIPESHQAATIMRELIEDCSNYPKMCRQHYPKFEARHSGSFDSREDFWTKKFAETVKKFKQAKEEVDNQQPEVVSKS